MTIVDLGSGPPVILVPGVQGRWEWLRPGVEALARHCRVITFSLADEPTADARFDETNGFGSYVDQIAEAMDQAGLKSATICGVSYGGLIAAAFAARHPKRTTALVLASAISASWHPDARIRFYLRAPALLSPLFCLASVRMYPELAAAAGGTVSGLRLAASHGWNVLRHMFSPARMARRVRLLDPAMLRGPGLLQELTGVHVPTLIVTGEEHLDRVVPVVMTRQYQKIWPHARLATLARSGHLGIITRPADFASLVASFVGETSHATNDDHIEDEVRRVV